MNRRQKSLVVKQHRVSRGVGGRSGRSIGFSVLAALVLLGPVILAAEPFPETRESSSGSGGASGLDLEGLLVDDASFDPVNGDWAGLLAGLPPHLSPEVALGEHAHWVFDRDGDEVKLREQPESVGGIFDQMHRQQGWDRTPVPRAPMGPEPLLSAIEGYALEVGVELPDLDLLRLQIALLQLLPEAEEALARLVVAYQEALRLNEEALADLTEEELAVLSRSGSAREAWLTEDPERSLEDYEAYRKGLAGRVDQGKQLAAADLLARTVDEVREPLLLPAAPFDLEHIKQMAIAAGFDDSEVLAGLEDLVRLDQEEGSADASASPADSEPEGANAGLFQESAPLSGEGSDSHEELRGVYHMIAQATNSPFDASMWPGVGDPDWDRVYGLIGTSMGFNPDDLPEIPRESLPEALQGLSSVLGVPGETLELPAGLDDLPVTLTDALAKIVTARRVGIESRDVAVHTFLLLEATRQAQPTLEAWAAIMDMERHLTSFSPSRMDQRELLTELLSGSPTPSSVLAHSKGLGVPELPESPASLAVLLEREGVPLEAAREAEQVLPLPVSLSAAYVLEAMGDLERVREEALAALGPEAFEGLDGVLVGFFEVLAKPEWSAEEARFVESWARAFEGLDLGIVGEVQQAQLDVLVAVEVAVTLSGAYADAVTSGTALLDELDQDFIESLGLQDVLLDMDAVQEDSADSRKWYQRVLSFFTGRIVGTASAQGVPEPSMPSCQSWALSDCSNDVWMYVPAGERSIVIAGFHGSTISQVYGDPMFILSLGGDDTYRNIAAGAAWTADELAVTVPVRVAIDLGGDDTYTTDADRHPVVAHGAARGFGTMGVLWNRDGDDTYTYTGQGEGAQGFGAMGGIGILVDEGGDDRFLAKETWAHGVARGGDQPDPDELENPTGVNCAGANQFTGEVLGLSNTDRLPCWLEHYSGYPNRLLGDLREFINGGGLGVLVKPGHDYQTEFHAGRGQGYAEGFGSIGLLYNEGGPTTYTTEFPFNEFYQGGHKRGDEAIGMLIDLGGAGSTYSNVDVPSGARYFHHDPDLKEERRDDSVWIHNSARGVGIGIDSTLRDESGNGFPNLVETLLGHDPKDGDDRPNLSSVIEFLGELVENPPDPEEDVEPLLNENLADLFPLPSEPVFCFEASFDGACEVPFHLLHVGGTDDNVIREPAHIMIELGGNNQYLTEVAGKGHFMIQNDDGGWEDFIMEGCISDDVLCNSITEGLIAIKGIGSYSLDLSGNDHYDTPDMSHTQGAVDVLTEGAEIRMGVSLLLNLAGDNVYEANQESQGAVRGEQSSETSLASQGSAWLVDFEGDDIYISESKSQGHVAEFLGSGGLIDLQGNDMYSSATRANAAGNFVSTNIVPPQDRRVALFFDGGGVDEYRVTGTVSTEDIWRHQGIGHSNPSTSASRVLGGFGVFVDFGDGDDRYIIDREDVSHLNNNVTRLPTQLGGPQDGGVFSDNPVFEYSLEDSDSDGAPNLVETVAGTDPKDPDDHPGTAWGSPERMRELLEDPSGIRLGDIVEATGLDGSELWLRIPGQLAIGGREDNTFDGYYALTASLGGDNTFTGPGIGGTAAGVALLMDIGGGDNTYHATSNDGECPPSLGATTGGVAMLVDMGGTNQFHAECEAPTQGAATAGFGFLGVFGTQGNIFTAPGGRAQGFGGNGGAGLLWTGTGDDVFEARGHSQGSGIDGGFGLLYSGGGNDVFRLHVDEEAEAVSQGAGTGAGSAGVLVNVAGDNQYLAAGATLVQGAATGGTGLLIDLGGNDLYHALDRAQGYASGAGAFGLLFDLQGRDAYILESMEGQGHGWGDSNGCGVFIDSEGADHYMIGGDDRSLDRENENWGEGSCGIGFDNDELRSILENIRDVFDHGVDEVNLEVLNVAHEGIADGTLTLRATVTVKEEDSGEDNVRRVTFYANNRTLGKGEFLEMDGDDAVYEYEWDTRSGGFPDGDYRLRASASMAVDQADAAGGFASPDLPAVHSDDFHVRVDNPPLMTVQSGLEIPELDVGWNVRNEVEGLMQKEGLAAALSPRLGYAITLSVTIGNDLDFPDDVTNICNEIDTREEIVLEGSQACEDLPPGGFLTLTLVNETGVPEQAGFEPIYLPNGTFTITLNPWIGTGTGPGCDQDPGRDCWEDGRYDLQVRLTDKSGDLNETLLPVLVDGTPPESWIATPEFAGANHVSVSAKRLHLTWDHKDDGSGVRKVHVFRFNGGGEGREVISEQDFLAHSKDWSIQAAGTGDEFWFKTAAIDILGNREHQCTDPNKAWPCHPALPNRIVVDFDAPRIISESVTKSQDPIAPGQPIEFSAQITEIGTGLQGVFIIFDNNFTAAMTCPEKTDTLWECHYGGWGDNNADYFEKRVGPIRERPYVYTIMAFDKAQNPAREFTSSGFIDEEPPRVSPVGVHYEDAQGGEHNIGRPGFTAVLQADVSDHAMGTVQLDVMALDDASQASVGPFVECNQHTQIGGRWVCTLGLPGDLPDGEYELTFHATDAVGNLNDTMTSTLVIQGEPVAIEDLRWQERHDGFRVMWNTSRAATSELDFARQAPADDEDDETDQRWGEIARTPGLRTEHAVDVIGLLPSTRYHFQVHSVSAAGVISRSDVFDVTTLNAYRFQWKGVQADEAVSGELRLDTSMVLLGGDTRPVQVRVFLQEVRQAGDDPSPQEVTSFPHPAGDQNFTIPTGRFADADYRVVFELNRAGDFHRVLTPVFRIDNTPPIIMPLTPEPGSTVNQARPMITLDLMDPMGRAPPLNHTLMVWLDGESHPVPLHTLNGTATGSDSEQVEFRFPVGLPQGMHEVEVTVLDEAGNQGRLVWSFRVDVAPPVLEGEVEFTPLPGPERLKPGGQLRVSAVLLDGSGVHNATLDLSSLGGDHVALIEQEHDRWAVTAPVPSGAPHGNHRLWLNATDTLGNTGIVAELEVFVDAHAPQITSTNVMEVGYTTARVMVETDKPVLAWAGTGDPPAVLNEEDPDEEAWTDRHVLEVTGLRPGSVYDVRVRVVDRAGHHADLEVQVETRVDDEPPGAVVNLTAASPEEGIVVLSWDGAWDNSGIDHYVVVREAAPRAPEITIKVPGDESGFRDTDAPAGREVTYRVSAVDLAGLEGPVETMRIDVLARPVLLGPGVTPQEGASDEAFTFQVTYRHAGDRAPDEIRVMIGDDAHPLERETSSPPCHEGCVYQTRLQLSPTPQLGRIGEAVFQATTDGQAAQPAVTPMPIVLWSKSDGAVLFGDDVESLPAPAVLLVLFILLIVAPIFNRQRRNSP